MNANPGTPGRLPRINVAFCTAAGLLCVALVADGFYRFRAFYHDDAFIALRYCRHLLNGQGLVWNPGERVEGFTSFLQVLLLAALGRLHVDLVAATKIIGVGAWLGLAAFCVAYAVRLGRAGGHDPPLLTALVALSVCNFPMLIWSLGGLETSLFSLLYTLAIWAFAAEARPSPRRILGIGVLFGLAAICRPDAVLPFVVTVGYSLRTILRGRRPPLTTVCALLGGFLMVFGPYYAWRLGYFGDPFPNTFYVKGAGVSLSWVRSGWQYMTGFTTCAPFVPVLVFGAATVALARRFADERLNYLLLVLATWALYVIWLGGDHMPAYRFFVPLVPTAALAVHQALHMVLRKHTRARYAAATLLVVAVLSQFVVPNVHVQRAETIDPAAAVGMVVGKWMDQHWPPGSLVALHTAGSVPYYAPRLRFLDMLGLNDRHIARRKVGPPRLPWQHVPGHAKGDGAYVLSRAPDYIVLGPAHGTTPTHPWFLSDLELGQSPEFHERYELHVVRIDVSTLPGMGHCRGRQMFGYYQRRKADRALPTAPHAAAIEENRVRVSGESRHDLLPPRWLVSHAVSYIG